LQLSEEGSVALRPDKEMLTAALSKEGLVQWLEVIIELKYGFLDEHSTLLITNLVESKVSGT